MTEQEALRAAFQALLRGDTAERDRILEPFLAKYEAERQQRVRAFKGHDEPILVKQPDGSTISFRRVPREH